MPKRKPIVQFATLMSYIAFSAPLHAEGGTPEKLVTFSGFGTLGAVHNQGDGSAFSRDITQPNGASNRGLFWATDSRIGIQANINLSDDLEGVAQVVSRYRTDNNFQPELTWGFLKYSYNDFIEIRGGRVGYDVFLGADSTDVGYSFLWVRPPVEYFGPNVAPYIDGGDITFRAPTGPGIGRLKLYSGLARQHIPNLINQTQWAGISNLEVGSLQDMSGSRLTGGMLEYQDNNLTLRLGRAHLKISHELVPGPIDILGTMRSTAQFLAPINPALASSVDALENDLSFAGKHTDVTSFGLAYENGPFRTQMAMYHLKSNTLLFSDLNSGYLSVGYRAGSFTPYAIVSAVRSKKSSRGDELAGKGIDFLVPMANFLITRGEQARHTYSIGMRYDLMSNVALKFQMDMVRNNTCSPVSLALTATSPPACSPPNLLPVVPVSWDGRATVYSVALDFTF